MFNPHFVHKLEYLLHQFGHVILMTVADSKGSSPGKRGFKMIVGPDGSLEGTIGGGKVEFELVEKARKDMIHTFRPGHSVLVEKVHDPGSEKSSGMICAGSQTVIITMLNKDFMEPLTQLKKDLASHRMGLFEITAQKAHYYTHQYDRSEYTTGLEISPQSWKYSEWTGITDTAHIIGAGHVGQSLAKLLISLSFHVILYDDRQDLINLIPSDICNELIMTDFIRVAEYIPEKEAGHFAIILTHSHESDEVVLQSLLNHQLDYLGMMGSKKKTAHIFGKLGIEKGLSHAGKPIYAPVGLDIKARSHQEIALSIAAQLITVRNQNTT